MDQAPQPQQSNSWLVTALAWAAFVVLAGYFGVTYVINPAPAPSPTPTPTVTASATASPSPSPTSSLAVTLASAGLEKPAPENNYAPALSSAQALYLAVNETGAFMAQATGTGCVQIPAVDPALAVTVFEMRQVITKAASSKSATVGAHYDPLIQTGQICAGKWYWLDVQLKAGLSGPKTIALQGIALTVSQSGLALPARPSMPLYVGLGVGDIMAQHGIPSSAGVSQIMPTLKNYQALMRAHGIEPIGATNGLGNPPIKSDGTMNLDNFGGVGSFRDAVMGNASAPVCMRTPSFIGQPWATAAELAAWQKTLSLEPGLAGAWAYITDEPTDLAGTAARAQLVRTNAPGLKVMVTSEPATQLLGLVDYFVPVFEYFKASGHWTDYSKAPGYWLYGSCMSHGSCSNGTVGTLTGSPDLMLDEPTIYARMYPLVAAALGAQAELYYDATGAFSSGGFAVKGTADPWASQYLYGGNGDGNVVYPCVQSVRPECPIEGATPSIRLKMLRQGLMDAEYLKHNPAAFKSAITSQFVWTKKHADIEAARAAAGAQ
jgi:hypothetical protein